MGYRVALSFFLLMTASASTLWAQKTPDTRVDVGDVAGSHYSGHSQIVSEGSSVFCVWVDRRFGSDHILFNRSLDYGNTWLAEPIRLDIGKPAGSSGSSNPQILVSESQIFVLWIDYRSYFSTTVVDIFFNRSLDGGEHWLPTDINISNGLVMNYFPGTVSFASSKDSVYIAWTTTTTNDLDTMKVHFNRSLDSGSIWLPSPTVLFADTLGPGLLTSLCANESTVYVAWSRSAATNNHLQMNHSLDKGTTWLPQSVQVDSAPQGTLILNEVQCACDGDKIYYAWRDSRNSPSGITQSHPYFNRSLDKGLTWLPADTALHPGGDDALDIDLSASGNRVIVTWGQRYLPSFQAGPLLFNRSLDAGTNFLTQPIALSGSQIAGSPKHAVDGNLIGTVWVTKNSEKVDVFANRSFDGGENWLSTPIRIDTGDSPGHSDSLEPNCSVSGDHIYAAWSDRRSGQGDIYMNLVLGSQAYGTGKGGSLNFIPSLFSTGVPSIGSLLTLNVVNGLGGANGLIALGSGKTSIPFLNGTLLITDPAFWAPLTMSGQLGIPGAGSVTLATNLPNDIALIGVAAYVQTFWFDADASHGLSMSNALEIVID